MKYYFYKLASWYTELIQKSEVSILHKFIFIFLTVFSISIGGTLLMILVKSLI